MSVLASDMGPASVPEIHAIMTQRSAVVQVRPSGFTMVIPGAGFRVKPRLWSGKSALQAHQLKDSATECFSNQYGEEAL